MTENDWLCLQSVGLTAELTRRARDARPGPNDPCSLQRVVAVHRDAVELHDGHGEVAARVHPRLLRTLAAEAAALAVGDWVWATPDPYTGLWVDRRVPPVTQLARRDAAGATQVLVSNVGTALLVMGLDGDFNPRRLERYLALVRAAGVAAAVVLTKADLAAAVAAATERRVALLRERLPPEVGIVAVDATDARSCDVLADWLGRGSTLALLGSSGAGKSTLTNTLARAVVQATGPISAATGRGRHTTTGRSLHLLPGGACIVDTPGLRTLRLDLDDAAVAGSFDDIASLAARCRFTDCRHAGEPGCAVQAGVDADRLRNYHKLLREAARDTMTPVDRQRQLADWKARTKAGRARLRMKRGDG